MNRSGQTVRLIWEPNRGRAGKLNCLKRETVYTAANASVRVDWVSRVNNVSAWPTTWSIL